MVWGEDFIPNVYLNGLEQSGIDRLGEDFIRTLKWVDAINQVNVKVINVDEFVSNIQKFLCPIRNTVSIIVIFLLFRRTAHDFKFGSKLAEQPAVGMHSKLRLSNAINGRDFVHVEVGEELHDDFRHLDISHEFWIVRLGDDCVDDFQGIQEGCDHLINTAGGENFLDTLGYGMFRIVQDDVAGLKRFHRASREHGLKAMLEASTSRMSSGNVMALSMLLTEFLTSSSSASDWAIRLINWACVFHSQSRVALPMLCTISVRDER